MKAAAAFFILPLLAGTLHADLTPMEGFKAGEHSYGIQLGGTRLSAPAYAETAGPGAAASLQYLRYSWNWIAFGIEASHQKFLPRKNPSQSPLFAVPAAAITRSEASASAAAVIARVNFLESSSWSPYALGGAGWQRFEQSWETISAGKAVKNKEIGSGLLVTAGAGLEFFALRDLSLSAEARFSEFRLNPRVFVGHAQTLSALLGFHFWFGRRWR